DPALIRFGFLFEPAEFAIADGYVHTTIDMLSPAGQTRRIRLRQSVADSVEHIRSLLRLLNVGGKRYRPLHRHHRISLSVSISSAGGKAFPAANDAGHVINR